MPPVAVGALISVICLRARVMSAGWYCLALSSAVGLILQSLTAADSLPRAVTSTEGPYSAVVTKVSPFGGRGEMLISLTLLGPQRGDLTCIYPLQFWRPAIFPGEAVAFSGVGVSSGQRFCRIKELVSYGRHRQARPYSIKGRVVHAVATAFGTGEVTGLLLSLTVGDRSFLSDSQFESFRALGIVHLLVLSGLHLSIAARFFDFSLRLILSSSWIRAGVVCCTLLLFMVVVGVTPPLLRAAAVYLYVTVGRLLGRPFSTPQLLLFPLLVVSVVFPRAVSSPGVQLSFAAVGSIYIAAQMPVVSPLLRALWVSFVCSLTTSAVACWWFEEVPLAGLFFSPLLTPVFGLVISLLCFPTVVIVSLGLMPQASVLFISATLYLIDESVAVLAKAVPSFMVNTLPARIALTLLACGTLRGCACAATLFPRKGEKKGVDSYPESPLIY